MNTVHRGVCYIQHYIIVIIESFSITYIENAIFLLL